MNLGFNVDIVSVLVLCKDNPDQLSETISSIFHSVDQPDIEVEIIVIDGSSGKSCADVCTMLLQEQSSSNSFLNKNNMINNGFRLLYYSQKTQGIYEALNEGLSLVNGQLMTCMNSGDAYMPGGLNALIQHWQQVSRKYIKPIPAVFGQARIVDKDGLSWLTPASSVRCIRRWLRWMVPCHQSLLFETNFARQHPYPLNSLVADRVVMRAAFISAYAEIYLPQAVCLYNLNGISSQWPSLPLLISYLCDPHRTYLELLSELCKWILRPVIFLRPVMMLVKSWLLGICCSFGQ